MQMKDFYVASSNPLIQSFLHTCVKMSSHDKLCHGILTSTIWCQATQQLNDSFMQESFFFSLTTGTNIHIDRAASNKIKTA